MTAISPQGTSGIVGDIFTALESRASIDAPNGARLTTLKYLTSEQIRAATPMGWDNKRMIEEMKAHGWAVAHVGGSFFMVKPKDP